MTMALPSPTSPLDEEGYVTVHHDGSNSPKAKCSTLTFRTDDGNLSPTSDFGCSEDSSYSIIDYLSAESPAVSSKLGPMAAAEPTQTSAKVTDWVKQQACEDSTANNMTHDPKPTDPAKDLLAFHGSSRKYDVQTLLQLRYTVNMSHVKLQINPEALQEPIFKRNSLASLAKASKRSRGLSEVSLNSLHSIPSEDEVIYRKCRPARQPFDPPLTFGEAVQQNFANRLPRRQPLPPPASALAQHHAGFARFLKEHASPPHQRVTAGGRIVPASGPPPIFNVDSLRALTSPVAISPSSAVPKRTDPNAAANELPAPTLKAASDAIVPASSEHTARESGTSSHRQTGAAFVESMRQIALQEAEKQQTQLGPASRALTANIPITLPDGSSVMFHNGMPYRLYWNGFQNVVEPVLIQQSTMPGSTATSNQQVGMTSQYSMASPYATHSNFPMMVSNLSSAQSLVPTHLDQSVPDHVLQRQQENLRYELKKLDKHIALRSHTFSSAEHATHVAQRKHLVEQMDTIRVTRGRRDRTSSDTTNTFGSHVNFQGPAYHYVQGPQNVAQNPYMLTNTGPAGTGPGMTAPTLTIGPPWDALINGTLQVTSPTDANAQSQQRTPSTKMDSGASKVLSPEAPPFVPSNMQGNHARKIETCLPHDKHSNDRKVVYGSPSTATTAMSGGNLVSSRTSNTAIKISTGDNGLAPSGKETRSRPKSATSGSWSAMDDIVPIVHQTDIAYANDLGLNPAEEPKLYCSTVTEFQEVIRRVREQARLYGCEGGQSKDPEFDAEQDIRWAIADSSPVPLPKKMPDHIANPRPWNWNDSAFNIRADRSHLKSIKKSAMSDWPENLKAAPSTSIKAPLVGDNGSVQDGGGLAGIGTDAARRKIKPASSNNSDPFGDSEQISSFEGTRTVLGELPINKKTTLTADTATATDNQAGLTTPPQNDVHNGKPTQHGLLEVPNAETLLKDKVPAGRQPSADDGKSTGQGRGPYQAYVEDDEESSGSTAIPAVVVTSATPQNDEVVEEPVVVTSATPQNEEVVEEPVYYTLPRINGKKCPLEMTMEELDAEIAANPPDPSLLPPRPPSPGWGDISLPPEILSKMPYNMEDLQRGPQGDPSVHMPNIHHSPNTNVEPSKQGAKAVGTKPLGYNEHKPISIPSRSVTSGKPSFLRDMLKTPRFATTNLAQQLPAGSMSSRPGSFASTGRLASEKENFYNSQLATSKAGHLGSFTGSHMGNRIPSSNDAAYSAQDARISKAQSSVASSSHYAQGYLPQHPFKGQQSSDYHVRYHMPQSYNQAQDDHPGFSHPGYGPSPPGRYPPQYDGPAESSPRSKAHSDDAVNDNGEMVNGITQADSNVGVQDFQIQHGDVPSGHSSAVDGFFSNIREAEGKETSSLEQKASNGI